MAGLGEAVELGGAATVELAGGAIADAAGVEDCAGSAIGAVAVGFPPQAIAMNIGQVINDAIWNFMAPRIKL